MENPVKQEKQRSARKQQILEALAGMLENSGGTPLTTARLAAEVGVSEAALYRHFPSKVKMFEGLIDFMEEAVFTRVGLIIRQEKGVQVQCQRILSLLLTFAERNPGISRILMQDGLAGDTARLRSRIVRFYDRLETQIRQLIREAEIKEGIRPTLTVQAAANLLLAATEGRISQFVRSDFKRSPTTDWDAQWEVLMQGFFRKTMAAGLQSREPGDAAG